MRRNRLLGLQPGDGDSAHAGQRYLGSMEPQCLQHRDGLQHHRVDGATAAWRAQALVRVPGTYMESMVPPPPASGSGEGRGGTQIQDPPLCSTRHARYHAAVRQKFGNSSCERSVTIQSATTAHVSPPGFLAVSSYHLLISPWPSPGLRPRGGEQISMP